MWQGVIRVDTTYGLMPATIRVLPILRSRPAPFPGRPLHRHDDDSALTGPRVSRIVQGIVVKVLSNRAMDRHRLGTTRIGARDQLMGWLRLNERPGVGPGRNRASRY